MHRDHRHLAAGHRPRLVEDDGVDPLGRLQHFRALDQQPQLRPATGPDQQRRRRRQPERAGAGDDQDRDRSGEGEGRPRPVAEPEAEGADGKGDDDRHEDAADPVGQPLHRRFARLRLGDQAGDLGQGGALADAGGADDEATADVDRRADDLLPRPDLDRHRLAGDQRLVDRRGAVLDDPVGRHLLPWPDDEAIADRELLDRDPSLVTLVTEHRDVLGTEVEQRLQRRPCPPLRPRLEVAAGEDEGGDHRRHLEVDLFAAGAALADQLERHRHPRRAGVEDEEGIQRPAERRQACRARSACPSSPHRGAGSARRPGGRASRPTAPPASPAAARATASCANCSGSIIASSSTGSERAAEKSSRWRRSAVGSAAARLVPVRGRRQRRRVADPRHRLDQILRRDPPRVELDARPLGREVDRRLNPVEPVEALLDPTGAGGAGHALDRELEPLAHRGTSTVNSAVRTAPWCLNWR